MVAVAVYFGRVGEEEFLIGGCLLVHGILSVGSVYWGVHDGMRGEIDLRIHGMVDWNGLSRYASMSYKSKDVWVSYRIIYLFMQVWVVQAARS